MPGIPDPAAPAAAPASTRRRFPWASMLAAILFLCCTGGYAFGPQTLFTLAESDSDCDDAIAEAEAKIRDTGEWPFAVFSATSEAVWIRWQEVDPSRDLCDFGPGTPSYGVKALVELTPARAATVAVNCHWAPTTAAEMAARDDAMRPELAVYVPPDVTWTRCDSDTDAAWLTGVDGGALYLDAPHRLAYLTFPG